MTSFTIYLTATGEIVRYGAVHIQDIPDQAQEGESLLIGVQGDFLTQKVDITQLPPVLVAK